MPRFVVLTHDYPFPHWDFMLETGNHLRTWRLLESPDSPHPVPAEPLGNHRLHYLDYEGPVGNNRGEVKRWDAGDYTIEQQSASCLTLRLHGGKLTGVAELAAQKAAPRWSFQFAKE